MKVNPFPIGLRSVLENGNIIKVFHDFCEDSSALVKQYDTHCSGVFDTQIAHRLLKKETGDPKD